MKRRYFTFEILLVLFALTVEVLEFVYPLLWSITLAIGVSIIFFKWVFEGFRLCSLAYIITLPCTIYPSHVSRILAVFLNLAIIWYYPLYEYQEITGKFFPGYKQYTLDGHLDLGIFYPTNRIAKPVPYLFSEKYLPWRAISEATGRSKLYTWFLTNHLKSLKVDVHADSMLTGRSDSNRPNTKVPVIIFSHGFAVCRNDYCTQFREWASRGFVVIVVQHYHDQLDRPDGLLDEGDRVDRNLKTRIEELGDVLDFISNKEKVSLLFDNSDYELDLGNVSSAGHCFGGAAATYLAANDPRVNGGCILLDPYLAPLSEESFKPLNKPLLIIRSEAFGRTLPQSVPYVSKLARNNVKNIEQTTVVFFRGSTHWDVTDNYVYIPREASSTGTIASFEGLDDHVKNNLAIVTAFLEIYLINKDNDPKPNQRKLIEYYNAYPHKSNLELNVVELSR